MPVGNVLLRPPVFTNWFKSVIHTVHSRTGFGFYFFLLWRGGVLTLCLSSAVGCRNEAKKKKASPGPDGPEGERRRARAQLLRERC